MKIADIYLSETLKNPLPYTQINKGRYRITLPNSTVDVITHSNVVLGVKCCSVVFLNPFVQNPVDATFQEEMPIRLFSTIVNIVEQLNTELIFFVADDTNITIQGKKASLYGAVIMRLLHQGRIVNHGKLNVPGFDKPVIYCTLASSRPSVKNLDDHRITHIAFEYGFSKLSL